MWRPILLVTAVFFLPRICLGQCANPILFVTQVPNPSDFGTANSTFGNHLASMDSIPRGGDLYIRYTDGSLKNLTAAAGFGNSGFQGAGAIAVRDPAVHWSGTKALFSMVIGAPTQQYQVQTFYWQLYEITGLAQSDTPVIAKVPNQPEAFNNVMPAYATDDRILFVTDRPRSGAAHLYPQLDEYESFATNTGLWILNPSNGELILLDHAPSGAFHPIVDSFGRVIYTRWDHLQRDQQNLPSQPYFQAFTWASEDQDAATTTEYSEVFPEVRDADEPGYTAAINLHTFNHFFPWMINEDGTGHETLNHIGRHELHSYMQRSFNDDPALDDFYGQYSAPNSSTKILNFFHIQESAASAGMYIGIDAPEFGTHAAGQVVMLSGAAGISGDDMQVTYLTHRDTSGTDATPSINHTGLYRNPLQCANGSVIASHTASTLQDSNIGTSAAPQSRYDFRLKGLTQSGSYFAAASALTAGIAKSVSWWSPDVSTSFSGNLWELQPVEVRARTRPAASNSEVEAPEQAVLDDMGISLDEVRAFLADNDLALVIGRNVTSRDDLDLQQPFNLRVAGTDTQTTGATGQLYDVAALQFVLGEQVRGYEVNEGRRVLPKFLTNIAQFNPENSSGPQASVSLADDGSWAAFLPARRALSWQLTAADGTPVVRERYWVSFARGEVRVCASCHGANNLDQAGNSEPQNEPKALRSLLEHWKNLPPSESSFKVKVSGKKSKKKSHTHSKKNVTFKITTTKTSAFNSGATLKLLVNGSVCAGAGVDVTISGSGKAVLNRSLPVGKAIKTIGAKLIYDGVERTSGSMKIKAKGKSAVEKVCQAFIR